MKTLKKFTRAGKQAEIVQVTTHGWTGNLIDRIKAKTTEKDKGLEIIDLMENRFNIGEIDKVKWREDMKKKEEEDFKEMEEHAKEIRKPFQFNKPTSKSIFTKPIFTKPTQSKKIGFTRDEKGRIVSPFASKKKLNLK